MDLPSLDRNYFNDVYAASDDPWHFSTSAYEAEKYDRTLATLGPARFGRALEIGCSIGVFTARLAERCDFLLAIDLNARALEQARVRCREMENVQFENRVIPAQFPSGTFDLIVVSEVGYYWSDADLAQAMDRIALAAPGGCLELIHFLPKVEDYPRDGDSVHEAFLADPRFMVRQSYRAERYRIDLFDVR